MHGIGLIWVNYAGLLVGLIAEIAVVVLIVALKFIWMFDVALHVGYGCHQKRLAIGLVMDGCVDETAVNVGLAFKDVFEVWSGGQELVDIFIILLTVLNLSYIFA